MRKFTFLFVVLCFGIVSYAQDTIRVAPDYSNGGALNKAIADNGPNKVYLLEANALYTLDAGIEFLAVAEGDWFQVVGETPGADEYMPVVKTGTKPDGEPFDGMFGVKADVSFKNIFIANQDGNGQIANNCIGIQAPIRFHMDGCVVDPCARINFLVGGEFSKGSNVYLTNNQFIRQGSPYMPDGHMLVNVYGDTVYIENNTFISTDHTIYANHEKGFRNELFWFNHNTVVWHDGGLVHENFDADNQYVNNNLFEDMTTYVQLHSWAAGDPDHGSGTYGCLVKIDTSYVEGELEPLPSSRTIMWNRNSLYVSDAVKDILLGHAAKHPGDMTQQLWQYPIVWNEDVPHYFVTEWDVDNKGQDILDASREAKMFESDDFPYMVEDNSWYDMKPNFVDSRVATHSVTNAEASLYWYYNLDLLDGTNTGDQKSQHWDVDAWAGTSASMYPTEWPRWDGAYTNATLLTASTAKYPLGDLNAFPAEKAKWEAEQDTIMAHILGLNTDHYVSTVNVRSLGVQESFSIYPNPANDRISVSSDQMLKSARIFNITGALVKSVDLSAGLKDINIADMNAGVYLLKVDFEAGGTYSTKLVKN